MVHKGTVRPFVIEQFQPVQLEVTALEDIKEKCSEFAKEEWIDVLIRSIDLNPKAWIIV